MFVELHMIQNFAPSNLNRDDTGAPKDCEFGGYRRARISSQCLKRAIRNAFDNYKLLPEANRASRTKRLAGSLIDRLVAQGKAEDQARHIVETALRGVGLPVVQDGKTQYLLFLGKAEMDAIAGLCMKHWDELDQAAASEILVEEGKVSRRGAAGAKKAKEAGKKAVPAAIQNELKGVLDGGKAVDVALFGRMLADLPDKNVDAACQVAHAISTNRVSMEFDFYTAVDDLKPEDTAGADMLGTVEFNSACFYRYSNVDLRQLRRNLGEENDELVLRAVEAFLRASVDAIPTGKQNSMAAQNPPSLVLAVVRDRRLWSLANAFAKPVRPDQEGDLVENSIKALDGYWGSLFRMYGDEDIIGKWAVTAVDAGCLDHLADARVDAFGQLVSQLLEVVKHRVGKEEKASWALSSSV